MEKIKLVAKREFLLQVKRWPFWLVTLGLPLFMVMIFVLGIGVAVLSKKSDSGGEKKIPPVLAVVDLAGLLDWESLNKEELNTLDPAVGAVLDEVGLEPSLRKTVEEVLRKSDRVAYRYRNEDNWEHARTLLEEKEVRGILRIDADFLTSFELELQLYNSARENRFPLEDVRSRLRDALLAVHYQDKARSRILDPLADRIDYLKKKEEANPDALAEEIQNVTSLVLPMVFAFAMMLVLLTSTDRLLRGMVEEKANRVIELLLSSVTAQELMAGKLIGLGLVGLLQLMIWLGFFFLPFSFLFTFFQFGLYQFLVFLVFFVFGYFFLATPILGFGSLGNNLQEANQWALVFVLGAMLPVMGLPFLTEEPSGTVAQVLTYVPLTSPLTVMLRLGAGAITPWEIGLSLVVLVGSCVLAVKVSAKIFRIGILMSGKPPTPAALLRAFRGA